jgi:hypothetical protein
VSAIAGAGGLLKTPGYFPISLDLSFAEYELPNMHRISFQVDNAVLFTLNR